MNDVLMNDKWNGCEWRVNQAEFISKVSVRRGDGLGRIGLKEKVGFQLFVELSGGQWEERVVGLSRWYWRKSTQMFGQWIPESRSLMVEGSVSNFEPRWIGRTLEGDNCGWTSGMSWLNFKNWIEFRLLKNIKHINYNKFECSFSKGSEGACL